MNQRLGIGLYGAGLMGADYHGPNILKIEDVKIVVIFSRTLSGAKKVAEKLGVKKFCNDLEEFLKTPGLDIVDVCTPTLWHEEITVRSAEAGKHVLCEKPIALTLRAADNMIKTTKKAGVKFMVAHCLRFFPAYATAKRLIDDIEVGKPVLASASRRMSMPSWSEWFKDPKISGGAVVDLQIHDLDYLNWLFGAPKWVVCQGVKSEEGSWDHVLSIISYKKGGKGFAEASFSMPEGFPFESALHILCEEGDMEVEAKGGPPPPKEKLAVYKLGRGSEHPKLPEKNAYLAEIEYFVNCVKNDVSPAISTPEDARLALEVALAARKSAENETIIKLPL